MTALSVHQPRFAPRQIAGAAMAATFATPLIAPLLHLLVRDGWENLFPFARPSLFALAAIVWLYLTVSFVLVANPNRADATPAAKSVRVAERIGAALRGIGDALQDFDRALSNPGLAVTQKLVAVASSRPALALAALTMGWWIVTIVVALRG